MELLFGFRRAGPWKGHRRGEVEGWAGQTGTDEDTGTGRQGCGVARLTPPTSAPTDAIEQFPEGKILCRKKGQTSCKS